jgi:hypothetical protein
VPAPTRRPSLQFSSRIVLRLFLAHFCDVFGQPLPQMDNLLRELGAQTVLLFPKCHKILFVQVIELRLFFLKGVIFLRKLGAQCGNLPQMHRLQIRNNLLQ